MALMTLNLKPSDKHLREFGEISLCMSNVVGLLFLWRSGLSAKAFALFCLVGVAVFLLSRISVKLVRPLYLALIVLTFPIGWVVSHVVMALFYFGVIGGIGLFFKLIGRDPLYRRYEPDTASYWLPYRRKPDLKQYFNQF